MAALNELLALRTVHIQSLSTSIDDLSPHLTECAEAFESVLDKAGQWSLEPERSSLVRTIKEWPLGNSSFSIREVEERLLLGYLLEHGKFPEWYKPHGGITKERKPILTDRGRLRGGKRRRGKRDRKRTGLGSLK